MPLFLTFQNCLSVLNQEYIINDYVLEKSRSLNTEEFFSSVERTFYMVSDCMISRFFLVNNSLIKVKSLKISVSDTQLII